MTTHTSNVSVPGWTGDGGYYISDGSNGGNLPGNENNAINSLLYIASSMIGFLEGAKNLNAFQVASGIAKYLGALALLVSVIASDGNIGLIAVAILAYILTAILTTIITALLLKYAVPALLIATINMVITAMIGALSILLSKTFLAINILSYRKYYA